ncbi:unnamed protein product [Pleuronectes platessa]|uniref:Uncharacterized protein n=1 Tax=Pleuronectes platessa TaxID=8262 RepID=A0A9N7U3N6_PLEPL|nr:unnamed protein product [Pleuronectes platessa]
MHPVDCVHYADVISLRLIPVGRGASLLKTATVESRHSMPCAGHHQLGLAQHQHYLAPLLPRSTEAYCGREQAEGAEPLETGAGSGGAECHGHTGAQGHWLALGSLGKLSSFERRLLPPLRTYAMVARCQGLFSRHNKLLSPPPPPPPLPPPPLRSVRR